MKLLTNEELKACIDELDTDATAKIKKIEAQRVFRKKIIEFTKMKNFLVLTNKDSIPHAFITVQTIEEVSYLLNLFTPMDKPIVVHETTVRSPYKIEIENPAKYEREVKIDFNCEEFSLGIRFPESIIYEFLLRSERNVYETEYHYFTGVSQKELMNRKITCYMFKGDQVKFYGGSSVCTNIDEINEIISYLKTT